MATLLKHEDFTGGTYDTGYWSAGDTFFTADHYTPSNSEPKYVSSSPSAALSGQCLHYFIKTGTHDQIPCRLQKNGTCNEFYVEFNVYFKSPFTYPAGLKLFRAGVGAGGGNVIYLEYNYEGAIVFYTYDIPSGTEHYTGNYTNILAENTWIKLGVYHRNSTPNVADGQTVLYIDGVLARDSGAKITRTTSVDKDFFWIGGNNSWSSGGGEGGGTTAGADSHLYFSNIKVYDGLPGQEEGGGDGGTVLTTRTWGSSDDVEVRRKW